MLDGLDDVFSALALGAIPLVWLFVVARLTGFHLSPGRWFPDFGSNELRAVLGAALVFAAGQLVSGLTERLGDGMEDDYKALHGVNPWVTEHVFPDGARDMVVPSERGLRVEMLLGAPDGRLGKLGQSMVAAREGIREDIPEELVAADFLSDPKKYCKAEPQGDGPNGVEASTVPTGECVRAAAQLYYTARNSVIKEEGQREELVALQRMIDFTRSLAYEMAALAIATAVVLAGRSVVGCVAHREPSAGILVACLLDVWVALCFVLSEWAVWWAGPLFASLLMVVVVLSFLWRSAADPTGGLRTLALLSVTLLGLWWLSRVAYTHYEMEFNGRVFGFYFSSLLNPPSCP